MTIYLDTNKRLEAVGWTVIRIWEHEDHINAAKQIADIIVEKRGKYR